MSRNYITGLIIVVLVLVAGYLVFNSTVWQNQNPITNTNGTTTGNATGTNNGTGAVATHPKLRNLNVQANSLITNNFKLTGEARTWYFEASFPVKLLDANGKIIAQGPAQAQGEWMTTEFVPFEATLKFITQPTTATGSLVLEADNPSGLPENADSFTIPVRFNVSGSGTGQSNEVTTIKLYYPNNKKIVAGVNECSAEILEPVTRTIPKTSAPLKPTIELLIAGGLTAQEKNAGFFTEFPNPGFKLDRVAVSSDGTATLRFSDTNNFTSGGSCRVSLLAAQISKTAQQFSTVKRVTFEPDTLFQP